MYRIVYLQPALDNLSRMRAFDRAQIVQTVSKQLATAPHVMGGKKKRIQTTEGNFVYQLAVGSWRVFYDVDTEVRITYVQKVKHKGRKTTGEIL